MLINDIQNNHTRGTDQHPGTITAAYDLMVNYQSPTTALHLTSRTRGCHSIQRTMASTMGPHLENQTTKPRQDVDVDVDKASMAAEEEVAEAKDHNHHVDVNMMSI